MMMMMTMMMTMASSSTSSSIPFAPQQRQEKDKITAVKTSATNWSAVIGLKTSSSTPPHIIKFRY